MAVKVNPLFYFLGRNTYSCRDSHPKKFEQARTRRLWVNFVWKRGEQRTDVWRTQNLKRSRCNLRALVCLKRTAASPATGSSGWEKHLEKRENSTG